jgi:N-acetylneuraminic acid mutarotase
LVFSSRRVFPRAIVLAALVVLAFPFLSFAAGGWSIVSGAMNQPRVLPRIVTLQDGRVLVLGGSNPFWGALNTVERYDPATKSWAGEVAWMAMGRVHPAVAVLLDGRVLVTSGDSASGAVEIYDPVSDTWDMGPYVPAGAVFSEAVTLGDGRVFLVGGIQEGAVTGATFLYSPKDNTWSPGPSLATPRALPSVTLLENGSVLVSGGMGGPDGYAGIASAELFDPTGNSWSPAGEMSTTRLLPVTVRLADGRVISAGGADSNYGDAAALSSADIYDPATNTWTTAASMSVGRILPVGGVLSDGTVVVAGGGSLPGGVTVMESSSERYDPVRNVWTAAGSMSTPRYGAAAAAIGETLFVAGGTTDGIDAIWSGDVFSVNHAPTVVASAPAAAQGAPGMNAAVAVSAAGSADPDGDKLTFTWSENGTTLGVTVSPTMTATLGLPVGPHTLTLTTSDGFGGTATTTVNVEVLDATAPLQAQIASLTGQLQQVQQQLAAAQQQLAAAQQQLAAAQQADALAVATIQTYLRVLFKDPSFTVPGSTPCRAAARDHESGDDARQEVPGGLVSRARRQAIEPRTPLTRAQRYRCSSGREAAHAVSRLS